MTYGEYAFIILGKFGVTDAEIEFILSEQGLNKSSIVSTDEDRIKIKTAIYYQIPLMIAGLQDVSEGGYSIKWKIAGIKEWYSLLASQLGLEDSLNETQDKVRNRSNIW